MVKRNYILQKIPLVVLDSTSSSEDESVDMDSTTSPVPPAPPAPPTSPLPPAPLASPVRPASPVVSRIASPRRIPTVSDDDTRDSRRPQYLGAPPIFPRNTHWMHGQVRKTTGLPPRRQLAPRDVPFSTHEVGESSQRPKLRDQLQKVTTELEDAISVIRETRNSLRDTTAAQQGLIEQVNVLEAGGRAWRGVLENRIDDSTKLIERNYMEALWQMTDYHRMLMVVAMVAAMAVLISALSFFIV